jgi:hypothetical protein
METLNTLKYATHTNVLKYLFFEMGAPPPLLPKNNFRFYFYFDRRWLINALVTASFSSIQASISGYPTMEHKNWLRERERQRET